MTRRPADAEPRLRRRRAELLLSRDATLEGEAPRALVRACASGALVRVRRGASVDVATWADCSDEDRHVLRVVAATTLFPAPAQHTFGGPLGVTETAGIWRTGLARTVVDLALSDSFASALASADWVLHHRLVTRGELDDALAAHPAVLGRARAERVLRHADERSESVGESLSRARMIELGVPMPELQVEVADDDGRIGRSDFGWPERRLVGESDGRGRYQRAEALRGRDPGDVVWGEKRREDRIRATGRAMVRWTWADALDRVTLATILRRAGLPVRAPSARRRGARVRGPRRRRR